MMTVVNIIFFKTSTLNITLYLNYSNMPELVMVNKIVYGTIIKQISQNVFMEIIK